MDSIRGDAWALKSLNDFESLGAEIFVRNFLSCVLFTYVLHEKDVGHAF